MGVKKHRVVHRFPYANLEDAEMLPASRLFGELVKRFIETIHRNVEIVTNSPA